MSSVACSAVGAANEGAGLSGPRTVCTGATISSFRAGRARCRPRIGSRQCRCHYGAVYAHVPLSATIPGPPESSTSTPNWLALLRLPDRLSRNVLVTCRPYPR